MKIFKIRNKNNGLFFRGGAYRSDHKFDRHNWTESGQTYHSLNGLRGALNRIVRFHGLPEHIEVVEVELVIISAKPPIDYINPKLVLDTLKK